MHPLAAPGALWVLSRAGKVPRPPAGGRNLSQGTDFLWKAGENSSLLFCFAKSFASAEATKGLSGRPLETFGVPPFETDGGSTKNGFFVEGRGKPLLAFFVSLRVSPLRRRPKGFPVALWKPSGFHLLRRTGGLRKINFLWKAGENSSLLFCFAKSFASAEATKGLSGRPLETFGVPPLERDGATKNGFFVEGRGKPRLAFLVLHRVSLLHGNYDQTVNNRQEINKTAKFVDFSASPRDQSIARGWQKFL